MSRDQNARQNHNIKGDDNSLERVEEFKCLGSTLTNQNYIQEEIKSRLKSRNACYHSVQNILSPSLLSKNLKIEIHRTNFAFCFVWVRLMARPVLLLNPWTDFRVGLHH
jgi:hypothetical protein